MIHKKLNLTLSKAEIKKELIDPSNKVWFNIACDGCTYFVTSQSLPLSSETINFNISFSLSVYTNDLSSAYIYVTLCYYGENENDMKPMARARSRIGRLPLTDTENHAFKIPLMSANDNNVKIASVSFFGTITTQCESNENLMNNSENSFNRDRTAIFNNLDGNFDSADFIDDQKSRQFSICQRKLPDDDQNNNNYVNNNSMNNFSNYYSYNTNFYSTNNNNNNNCNWNINNNNNNNTNNNNNNNIINNDDSDSNNRRISYKLNETRYSSCPISNCYYNNEYPFGYSPNGENIVDPRQKNAEVFEEIVNGEKYYF